MLRYGDEIINILGVYYFMFLHRWGGRTIAEVVFWPHARGRKSNTFMYPLTYVERLVPAHGDRGEGGEYDLVRGDPGALYVRDPDVSSSNPRKAKVSLENLWECNRVERDLDVGLSDGYRWTIVDVDTREGLACGQMDIIGGIEK